MNDIDIDYTEDNNDKFRDFSVFPDHTLNEDPEDEDTSDCNLLGCGFHVVATDIDEDEPISLVEERGHKFALKTK